MASCYGCDRKSPAAADAPRSHSRDLPQAAQRNTAREAAQLLRLTLGEYLAWISADTVQIEMRRKKRQLGGRRHQMVSWEELASAALVRWTVMEIHDALGEDANHVLPRLLRPVAIQSLRLPEYQVRLFESLAKRDGVTMEEYIFNALLNVETACDPEEIERLLPGFHEAMAFPGIAEKGSQP